MVSRIVFNKAHSNHPVSAADNPSGEKEPRLTAALLQRLLKLSKITSGAAGWRLPRRCC